MKGFNRLEVFGTEKVYHQPPRLPSFCVFKDVHESVTPWSKISIPPLANFHQKRPIPYFPLNNFQSFSVHPSCEYFVHDISQMVHLVI